MGERLSQVVWELHRKVVAISGGMVSKWERGERRPTKLYREACRVLCNATDEELGFLNRRQLLRTATAGTMAAFAPDRSTHLSDPLHRPSPVGGKSAGRLYAPRAAAAIRQAMLGCGTAVAQREPDAEALGQRTAQAWQLRQNARYVALGSVLPALIVDAETASRELGGDASLEAHRALTHTYNTTSSVLKKLGDFEFASIAADRAIRAAQVVGDRLLISAASYRLANVFLPADRLAEAKSVAIAAADALGPGLDSSPARLATWGGLVLTAAIATAREGAVPEAWELIGEATTASHQLGKDYADLHTIFGPTNVAIHGVQIAAELGDGRQALRRAARIDADRLPPMLLERRTHFLAALTGHPVRSDYKRPEDPDVLPPPDAVVVAPATFNTINKWAAGISDTLALGLLNEAVGLELPIIAVPFPNTGLARHPAFIRSLAALRELGVRLVFDPDAHPLPTPNLGPPSRDLFAWDALRGEFAKLTHEVSPAT